jgi:hypothetical protein
MQMRNVKLGFKALLIFTRKNAAEFFLQLCNHGVNLVSFRREAFSGFPLHP